MNSASMCSDDGHMRAAQRTLHDGVSMIKLANNLL